MILDSLENSKRIECIHPLFKQALTMLSLLIFQNGRW